ncbi:MFS transporter [Paracrocinitomix mangrovi]|uniref:MFS transporter n=1 Tax=Paracrocinitomix mangrovi TaxID=2862509 RepID=UPI001C8DB30C|nr:MFS transporter [Paracrocinitomix mangrovi]UKN01269.1 MFS transporter [Paracrocinitomix mangrovi]
MSTTSLSHPKEAFLIILSKMLERMAYYGTRSFIIFFLIDIEIPREEALEFYGQLSLVVYASMLIGGVLGDYLVGNKISCFIGGGLQILALLLLSISNVETAQTGLILFGLGAGIYSPNNFAMLSRYYYKKKRLVSPIVILFYVGVNLGAFLSAFVIYDSFDYKISFIIIAIILVLSLVPLFFVNNIPNTKNSPSRYKDGTTVSILAITIIASFVYWGVYELFGGFLNLQEHYLKDSIQIESNNLWSSMMLNSVIIFILGIVFFFVWSSKHMSQIQKMLIGFILAFVGFGIYFILPIELNSVHLSPFLFAVILVAISEFFIQTALYSLYLLLIPQRHFTIFFAFFFFLFTIVNKLVANLSEHYQLYDNKQRSELIGLVAIGIVAIGILLFKLLFKPQPNPDFTEEDEPEYKEGDQDILDDIEDNPHYTIE